MTFVATTNACLYNNLKINLVDINLDNFNLKIDDLEKKLSKKDKKKTHITCSFWRITLQHEKNL